MTSACITLARTVCVHHHLQGEGLVFSSGHVAALGSGWCGVSKKEGERKAKGLQWNKKKERKLSSE